jgi:hypothetical protein
MRQLTVFLACLALACYGLAGVASAGDGFFQTPFAKPTQASYSPGCVTPVRPDCGVPGHPQHCGCRRCNECCQDVPCQKVPCVPEVPKEGPPPTKEVPPQLEYLPKEAGAYVAPPRVGATRGAVVQRGVETGAITFPEIKLKFPCIEWPCCFASRTQAKMYVESGVAPWESHGIVNAAAGTNEALLLKRIADLEKALEEKGAPAPKGAESPADQAAREKAAAEDYARKLEEYQRLLEQCEKQQEELRACIRQCLEQHQGGAKSPGGEPPRGPQQSPIQKSHGGPQQTPHDAIYGPKPVVDPNAQAWPPTYPERPAAYVAEPVRMPAERQWIREPAAPTARITGLRPIAP